MRSITVILFATVVANAADTAAMFRGNARHTGVYDSSAPALTTVKWEFKTNGRIFSSPAVSDDTVFVGSNDHNLYAVNAADGTLKWKFDGKGLVNASPAVANGVVYIMSTSGSLFALDAATGAQKWKFTTTGEKCRDSNLYAVDAATGTEKWKFNNKGSWVITSPAVHDGRVYFATSDSSLFQALDAKTGAPLFQLATGLFVFSSPAIAGGMAYFGNHAGSVKAVDLKTQKIAAEFRTEASKENLPKYLAPDGKLNQRALYPDFTLDGIVIGLDRLYSFGSVFSSPVIHNGILYVGSTDGHLYALR
jgi:outer membrane protein assembly factor BamB